MTFTQEVGIVSSMRFQFFKWRIRCMLNSSVAGEIDHELSTDRSIKTFCWCNFKTTDYINLTFLDIKVSVSK
jgi:hypothetical protein